MSCHAFPAMMNLYPLKLQIKKTHFLLTCFLWDTLPQQWEKYLIHDNYLLFLCYFIERKSLQIYIFSFKCFLAMLFCIVCISIMFFFCSFICWKSLLNLSFHLNHQYKADQTNKNHKGVVIMPFVCGHPLITISEVKRRIIH